MCVCVSQVTGNVDSSCVWGGGGGVKMRENRWFKVRRTFFRLVTSAAVNHTGFFGLQGSN